MLLDLHLPDRSGHEVLEAIRADPATRLLPVVMLTGMATASEKMRAQSEGVTDFIPKPFSQEELLPRVRALVMLKLFADEHEHAERVILTLAKTIDARDPYTAGHSGRVAEYADRIAARMGLDTPRATTCAAARSSTTSAKSSIPDAVLRKPGALNAEERKIIEEHPVVGHDLLSPMKTMRKTLPVVYHHHERLDGSGYPEGISGGAIPMTVRIVTIADIFDALTTDRAYRGALSVSDGLRDPRRGRAEGLVGPRRRRSAARRHRRRRPLRVDGAARRRRIPLTRWKSPGGGSPPGSVKWARARRSSSSTAIPSMAPCGRAWRAPCRAGSAS